MSDAKSMIDESLEMASEFDWFDDEFLISLADQYDEKGFLTTSQFDALSNIYEMLKDKYDNRVY